jgi:hypothetical protein
LTRDCSAAVAVQNLAIVTMIRSCALVKASQPLLRSLKRLQYLLALLGQPSSFPIQLLFQLDSHLQVNLACCVWLDRGFNHFVAPP